MSASQSQITHIGTVIVPVSDQDAALEFYVGKLGFEVRLNAEIGEGMRWLEVAPAGAETSIALTAPRESEAQGIEVSFATEDAEADHAGMLERVIDADAELILMGDGVPPMFMFRDPDGNQFRMVDRPR